MIASFADKQTEALFYRNRIKRLDANLQQRARYKLESLNAASNLNELREIPGNKLETLKGDRKGQYSIRINNKWRICFIWKNDDAYNVEIVDYH